MKLYVTRFRRSFHCGGRIWELLLKITKKKCSSEKNSYYWLSYDGLKKIISMNTYDHLELEQMIIEKKRHFSY